MFGLIAASLLLYGGTTLAQPDNAYHLVKRSDDQSPLTPVVQQLSAQLSELSAKLTAMESKQAGDDARLASLEKHVAFNAQFSEETLNAPASGPYTFDLVIFNDGNAYDPLLGVFTAPYAGVYMFATQLFTVAHEKHVTDIVVNGNITSRMALDVNDSDPRQSTLTSVMVKLSAGDRVWVRNGFGQSMDVFGQHHTFFTGILLYAV